MARAAAVAVLAALGLSLPGTANAAWSQPFSFSSSVAGDVGPPTAAVSASGAVATAYTVAGVGAFEVRRGTAPQQIAGAASVLDVAFAGSSLVALVRDSAGNVSVVSSGARRTLVRGVSATAAGRLVALRGGLLAAVASEEGVWVSQSHGARFGRVRRLAGAGAAPQALAAGVGLRGGAIVAWAAPKGGAGGGAGRVVVASGSGLRPHTVYSAAGQHAIDQVAVAGATVAWSESWFDPGGAYRSVLRVRDLSARRVGTLAAAGTLASDPTLAGDQLVAWKACTRGGGCSVFAGKPFGHSARLGSIDVSEDPAGAAGSKGSRLLGWISGGRVMAASSGRTAVVSPPSAASDLALAFGPGKTAVAAWVAGNSVMGAAYQAG